MEENNFFLFSKNLFLKLTSNEIDVVTLYYVNSIGFSAETMLSSTQVHNSRRFDLKKVAVFPHLEFIISEQTMFNGILFRKLRAFCSRVSI